MASFLGEIKRRKVFQVAAVYLVVAWLIVQIVATVEAPLRLPEWADTLVIVLLAVGFPVALILSWAFDITPDGVVRDAGGSGNGSGRRIEYVLIALLVVAVGWVIYRVEFEPVATVATVRADVLPNSVAVLPFENLSPNPDNDFFAAGIHEEILGQLAKIRDLSVISRTSVLPYAETELSVPELVEVRERLRFPEWPIAARSTN